LTASEICMIIPRGKTAVAVLDEKVERVCKNMVE
jgi:hypothetical protein